MAYDIFNNYMKKYLNESVENNADNNHKPNLDKAKAAIDALLKR